MKDKLASTGFGPYLPIVEGLKYSADEKVTAFVNTHRGHRSGFRSGSLRSALEQGDDILEVGQVVCHTHRKQKRFVFGSF